MFGIVECIHCCLLYLFYIWNFQKCSQILPSLEKTKIALWSIFNFPGLKLLFDLCALFYELKIFINQHFEISKVLIDTLAIFPPHATQDVCRALVGADSFRPFWVILIVRRCCWGYPGCLIWNLDWFSGNMYYI